MSSGALRIRLRLSGSELFSRYYTLREKGIYKYPEGEGKMGFGTLGALGALISVVISMTIITSPPFLHDNKHPGKSSTAWLVLSLGLSFGIVLFVVGTILEMATQENSLNLGLQFFLTLMFTGIDGYGFYMWHKYKKMEERRLLQEAIAKGVEIGMKKAKES